MLVVETYLAPDAFGGVGLFSKNFINKGTIVWQYDPLCDHFYSIEEYNSLHPEFRKVVAHYGYRARISEIDEVLLSQDNDRYMNHSYGPNIRHYYKPPPDYKSLFDSRYHFGIAAEDILPGTEITADYRDLNSEAIPPDTYKGIKTCVDFLSN